MSAKSFSLIGANTLSSTPSKATKIAPPE